LVLKKYGGMGSRVLVFIFLFVILQLYGFGQSHNYWTESFNEESSLLSGAVVGGGAGPSAIYYNPSGISEITESKFSLHASLFSIEFINIKNALGDGINLNSTTISVTPRFVSFMIKPKKHPEWSFEIAFLNNEDTRLDFTKNVDYLKDVLKSLPGEERYNAFFQYLNYNRDDWFGIGGSWNINRSLFLGASLFVTVKTFEYRYTNDIEAFSLDDTLSGGVDPIPFYSATYQSGEYLKFTDFRILWKLGAMYSWNNISVGASLTTPSINVFSSGKKVSRKLKENNITDPETGEPLPGFILVDYQEGNAVSVNAKSPLSVAAGLNYTFEDDNKTLYTTLEYFKGIPSYNMVYARENQNLGAGIVRENIEFNEWLTFISGASPVINLALGYKSKLKENLMLMTGFRTDFNYRLRRGNETFSDQTEIKGLDMDFYHLSGGLTLRVLGQDLIVGLQYSFGFQGNQKQLINLSDPVEFNHIENAALQGTRKNNMSSMRNSLSFYFGATLNFGSK